jgi:hypothetical protein
MICGLFSYYIAYEVKCKGWFISWTYMNDLVLGVKVDQELYYTPVSSKFMDNFVFLNAALVAVCPQYLYGTWPRGKSAG